jgi:AcrR family transcriptional regulator
VSEATVAGAAPAKRLPPGRHGLPRELVRESQRQRLTAAASAALAERGYGEITVTEVAKRAGVSTATFYKHFDDLWACLLAAYEAGVERLGERIESACAAAASDSAAERGRAGIAGALALLAAEPALTHLLATEPPSQAAALWAARRRLVARLVALLRKVRERQGDAEREARLVGGALALVSIRARSNGAEQLRDLAPALTEFLLAP